MSNNLFDTFDSVSAKQWKQKIQFDLDGADYNNMLIWKTNEDIDVKPFYHADDLKKLPNTLTTKATTWKICQEIYVADVKKSNLNAIDIISRGAENIKFIIPSDNISIKSLTENINTSAIPLYFELSFLSEDFIKDIYKHVENSKVQLDIIGNLTKTGNWFKNLNHDFKLFKALVNHSNSFSIDISLYQNAGANITQQLAYALAHANEYLNTLQDAETDLQLLNITFNTSVSTNYFFEIAKLRALRVLWKTLALQYNANTECHITTTSTKRNKTLYDYNTNMLRSTTECMSAILGGANAICNLPYNYIYHKSNEFGERIARNQLLVLKHESYFDKVNNPADGSYYIENLTTQLAENALNLFKKIEASGGFLKQLKLGTIQRKIKESDQKEQNQFDKGEMVLLGTNKYPNTNDKMKDKLELYPFVKSNPRKTLIEPIIEKRLSEHFEQKRLKNEN